MNLNLAKIVKLIAGGIVALVLISLFFSSIVTVSPGTRGVVTDWGQVQPEVLEEGLHFVQPVGVKVHEYNIQTSNDAIRSTAATKDMQQLTADTAINWHPDSTKLSTMYEKYGDRAALVNNIVSPAVNEVLKAAAAKMSAEDVLKNRIQLKTDIDDGVSARLLPYGIIIENISLVNLEFSDDYNKAIEAKQVAEQEAQQAVYEAQKAQQEAAASVNRAKGEAEAQRLQRDTITPELLRLKALEVQKEAIEKWNGELPNVNSGAIPFIQINPEKEQPAK